MSRPATLGDLRASGWESRPVKEEVRANAVRALAEGRPLVDGVIGYEDTVLPQLANALLAGHDVIFLGERGQAKTRIIRSLVEPARRVDADRRRERDQRRPVPPVSSHARVHRRRTRRRHADRVGAPRAPLSARSSRRPTHRSPTSSARSTRSRWPKGRYLSDELTIHYGLVPRTNRGIFAINELPDLAERIQVGLLNVLEERDVQIRGYKIRLPLDVLLRRVGEPRGLHEPRAHHHAAQGPFRFADPNALPARHRARDGDHRARGAPARGRRPARSRARLHDRDRRRDFAARAAFTARQPAIGCVGAFVDHELRDVGRQRGPARVGERRARSRAARLRPRRARGVDVGQDRDRDARRRSREPGARAHREGRDARGVPGTREARTARPDRRIVRRRQGRAHR